MATNRTVDVNNVALKEELVAGGTITPGMLLELEAAGTVVAESGDSIQHAKRFALEKAEIGDNLDVDYASGDQVTVGRFQNGALVNALIGTIDVTRGAFLVSAGDGTLKVITIDATTEAGAVVAQARETVSNAMGSGNVRLLVEIV